ncbi:MAG: hypothetical protein KDE04_02465 [Anaerolineales bacterium]|nr:hypothetical protein [Anaerolineales bacterium]
MSVGGGVSVGSGVSVGTCAGASVDSTSVSD